MYTSHSQYCSVSRYFNIFGYSSDALVVLHCRRWMVETGTQPKIVCEGKMFSLQLFCPNSAIGLSFHVFPENQAE